VTDASAFVVKSKMNFYTDVNFVFQLLINNFIVHGYKILWEERKRNENREMEVDNDRQKNK